MASPLTLSQDEFKKRYGDITAPESDVLISLTPEEFDRRYNGKSAPQIEQPPVKPISLAEKAFKSFGAASAGVIGEPAAAAIDILGGVDTAAAIRKRLGEVQAGVQREVPELGKEFKFEDLSDPSFYATKGVSVLPALIALAGTGAGAGGSGARGALGLASRLGVTGKALKAAEAIGEIGTSALVSRTLEGALEASGTYNQLLNEGVDREKAADAAAKVFRNNYALTGMDAAQYAAATLKLPPALSKGLVKWAAKAVKLGVASGSEGLEELYQGYVAKSAQEYARGQSDIDGLDAKEFWSYSTRAPLWQQEEFVIGALFGLGFQVGEGALAKYGKTEGELRQAIKRNPQEVIQTLKGQADEQRADNATREKVAQQAFGKKFDDLTDEQKQKIVDKAAEQKTAEEDARIDETLQGASAQAEPMEAISQQVYGKPYAELPLSQRQALKKRYQTLSEKAQAKKIDDAIAEKVGLKKPKAEKPARKEAQPPAVEPPPTEQAAAAPVAPKESVKNPAKEKPEVATPKAESSPSQPTATPSPVSARAGEEPQPSKAAVVDKPLSEISTDTDRFQNRATDFSEKTAATVSERFDPNLFDPIVLWKDPQNGKDYVLSGHSRLEGMKRRGEKNIPSRYFQGTEAEAMNFAKVEANRLGSAENLQETIKAYKQAKRGNATKSKLKDLFDGDVDFLESAQNLNESGDFIRYLGQGAATEFPYIKRFSRWVGELRKNYGDKLTDRHEQQVFDWLYKSEKRNREVEKDRFFELIEKQVSRTDFDPNAPLQLKRGEAPRIGTRVRSDTAKLEAELDQLRADKKNARTPAEAQAIDKEIARVETAIKTLVKTQPDLFGAQSQAEPGQKQATHKEFDIAFERFQEVAAQQSGKPASEQSAAIAEELRKQNVNPVIIDELTNSRRALKPRDPESDRSATSRPERIARAVHPPAAIKQKVDAIATANVDFRNKEAALLKAREEIKSDIEARGGEVVVDTDTGAMTITLRPGKAKISDADKALIDRLRAEAAEAGAYSLATVGQGFEISATPERIADAESLPKGDFKARALEFLRRNADAKAAEKVFKQAKEDARNDLVDYYLAERVSGKETPSALLGRAKDGTRVEVMARRVRSAAEPDLAVGGRNFPEEIATAKKEAKARATETGEPFIEARKAGEKKVDQAKDRGAFVAEKQTSYKSKKQPWEMTSTEYEIEQTKGMSGDWFNTPDGKLVKLGGASGLGSNRVKVYGINGKFEGYYNRDELAFVRSAQRSNSATEAADKWLENSTAKSNELKEKHRDLLLKAGLYDRFAKGVSFGEITKERFKELQEAGKIISDREYSKAQEIRKQIDEILESPLATPVNEEHRSIVEKAIAEGKKVPQDVLAEYPDLAKKSIVSEQSEGYHHNRPGDFLTNPDAVFEQKSYEPNYKKRPDATPRTDRLAREAVEAIGHNRRRGRVYLANAINAEAREKGAVTLVGQTIRTSDDLAVLAQVYRDPRWETLRYIFVKDGKVVNVTGVSNRLPSAASAYPFANREDGLKWLKGLMDKTGADGYYLLHNHPSGVSKPSQLDIEMTAFVASKVPGFKEHVVIDSNEFSVLSIPETTGKEATVVRRTIPKNFGVDRLLKPSIDHPLIGRVIESPNDAVTVAKGLESKDGWITLISTSQGRVRGIMQVEEALMKVPGKRRSAIIRNFARQTGGMDTFAVVSDDFMRGHGKALTLAVERGFIRDAVTMRGYSVHDQFAVSPNREFSFGRIIKSGRVVNEGVAKQEIPDKITVSGKERPTRNSKGQLIHATREGIENFWKWFGDSKVVDEQGRPMVVYHGTGKEFEIFDTLKSDLGSHFSVDARVAKRFASDIYDNPRVVKGYLLIKNPLRLKDMGTWYPNRMANELFAQKIITPDEYEKYVESAKYKKSKSFESRDDVLNIFKKHGYDGIVYLNRIENGVETSEKLKRLSNLKKEKVFLNQAIGHESVINDSDFKTAVPESEDSYIVFKPTQIKSATGNQGAFSPEEPSIVREQESTYGKAGLNREQFLDLGKMVNDFLQSKEQVANLSKEEREEFAAILDVLKEYKELSERADLSPVEKTLLRYAVKDIESPEGRRVIEKVQTALKENKPIEPSALDKVAEWTTSMYLWRLASVGSSLASNIFRQLLKYGELKLSAWYNKGIARIVRVERTRFSEEAEKDFKDAWTGEEFKKAAQKALDIMAEKPDAAEESKFFEREKVNRKSIGGKKGTIIRAGLNAQAAIDVLFRQPATTSAIARHAFREAAKTSSNRVEQAKKANAIAQNVRRLKTLKDAKHAVPEYLEKFEPILAKAEADAEAQTFQSELDGFLKHVSEIRRYPIARIFVPFFNTRMNVLLQAYARTPLSAFGSELRDLGSKFLKKSLTADEAGRLSDRMAEITLGTAALLVTTAALYGLSDDDEELITGDFDEKTIGDKPAGWLPNAVRVGDTYVSMKGFEPYATIFTAFGNAASGKKSGIRNAGEALAKAAFSNPMTDELFDIMGSLKDGDADKFFVDMVAGAATPGLLQDISKIVDPTIRQKEGLEERFKSRVGIPGLSTTLPERIDVFGEDLQPQTRGEKTLKALTGVSISKSKEDPARREIRKLGLKHSLNTITHKGVSLEPWEVLALNKSIGEQYHETVLKLLQNPTYLAADKEARKAKLRSVRKGLIDKQKAILERTPYFMARERAADAQKQTRERVKKQLAE